MRRAFAPYFLTVMLAGPPLLAAPPATETPLDAAGRNDVYAACMTLARSAPAKGLAKAEAWRKGGGGSSAKHCAAVARAGLGQFDAAAEALESLAWELPESTPDRIRAQILAQAGQIWLDAGQSGKANALLTTAIELAPKDVEIRIDRAMTLGGIGRYQDAIIDLSAALLLDDRSIDALVLRASAYRHTKRPERAIDDIERALALAPNNPEALLERGLVRRLFGDEAGARIDWQRIIQLHPTAPAATVARDNLNSTPQR
jgi:tetratricopeptide (TPR) repeat protein